MTARASKLSRGDLVGVAVAVVFYTAAMAVALPALRHPGHVERITIDNPHPWRVYVDVTNSERRGWLGIGGVDRDTDQTFRTVLDQGDTWIFLFAYAGQHSELRVTRRQLEQHDWHITVPDQIAQRLRAAGVPETPLI